MIAVSANRLRWAVGIVIFIHFSLLLLLGLSRHWGYMSSINDLGVFDQAIWGTLQGAWFHDSIIFNKPINWLGFHFNPILVLFVPLYVLSPSAEWFAIAQALTLSLTAWPIFLLASRVFQSEQTGLVWVLIYLANPFLLNAAAWDFHPITLAVPFIAIGMLAIEKRSARLLLVSCLVILFIQEHLGLMVIGFGLLWWFHNKDWKPALALIALGMTHSVLVLGIFMPALSPTGGHPMFGVGLGQLSRYSWLGNSLSEVIETLLTHPLSIVRRVMLEMNGALYLGMLLLPFVALPLGALEFLLPGLGDLAANMLSANPMPRIPVAYHSVGLVPVFTGAAIYGVKRLAPKVKKLSPRELAGFVFLVSFIGGYCLAPLPLPNARNLWAPTHFLNWPDSTVKVIRSVIGDTAAVSVQANVGAHFSQRREIYIYPNKVGQVDAIVLRLDSPTAHINDFEGPSRFRKRQPYMLDGHLQMDRTEYLASVECLLSGNQYGVLLWNDSWLVLSRGIKKQAPQQEIELKLNQLREDWQVKDEEYQASLRICNSDDWGVADSEP